MQRPLDKGNAAKSHIRGRIKHVAAEQKHRINLCIRSFGLWRAEASVTFAKMVMNMKCCCWLNSRSLPA